MTKQFEQATLGAGCFWCVEAVFQNLAGVETVASGYAGGHAPNPSYEQVCTGATGHAEVAQITFDPAVVSFAEILDVFWRTHDPTTRNRQGADVGTQYRSVIFCHTDEQRRIAEESKAATDESGLWQNPIVTEIVPLAEFYPAEDYHQNYFRRNPHQPYCQRVVAPKVEKFKLSFSAKLKKDAA